MKPAPPDNRGKGKPLQFFLSLQTGPAPRYLFAVIAVGMGCLLRLGLADVLGLRLPYITFFPVIMLAALFCGFGPGLLATGLSALYVGIWMLPPIGEFAIADTGDAIGLALFGCIGVFMSTVAGLYHQARAKLAALEQEQAGRAGRQPPAVTPTPFQLPTPSLSFRQHLAVDSVLALVLAILVSVGWLAYRDMNAATGADQWVTHSNVVINELDRLLSCLKDAERGQRGYIITADQKYLETYRASLIEIETHLASVRHLTVDNPHQQQRFAEIAPLVAAKLAELEATINLRDTKGYQAASEAVMMHLEKNLMDQLRALVGKAEQEEDQLLRQRTTAKEESTRKTIRSVAFGGMLGGFALLALFIFLKFELLRRYRAEAELRAQQERLTELVDARTKELRQERESLLEREGQLRLFVEHTPVAVAMLDTQMRYMAFSNRWMADYNLTGTSLIGRSHYDVFPELPERWKEIHKRCLAGAVERANEDRFERADGSAQWIRWEVRPWQTGSGAIGGIIIFSEEITARKQAEEQLRLLSTALEAADNGAAITDLKGTVQWVNAAFTRLTGYSRAEAVGQNPRVLKSGKHSTEFYRTMWGTILRGESWRGQLVNRRKDGSLYTEEMTITPVHASSGGITHFVAIKQDITERLQAEADVRRLNAELEERVQRRTADLQAVNKELEAFCYSVAHDLRAPLRSIDGFSQAVLQDYGPKLDAEGKSYLEFVRNGCQQMGHLIEDLLKLSRVTRTPMRHDPVNFTELAQQIACDLRRLTPGRAVQFRIDDGLTTVGDAHLLEAALRNLIENAWKFTAQRAEAVIEVGVLEKQNGAAFHTTPVFFVRDNGVGFDMAHADKLFAPFQRLHSVAEYPGSGIGLATVQRILQRHGGRIWAEALIDRGATLYFTLNETGQSV